jgi:thiol-disulfide isomerase/thioredoxin
MDPQPLRRDDLGERPAVPDTAGDGPPPGFDRFVETQSALDQEAGTPEPATDQARPSRKAAWLAMGAVALALGLLYLAPGSEDRSTSSSPASSAAQDGAVTADPDVAADALAVGKPAPLHFTMTDMNGVDVKLASFKGKVILLNFWATWCGPCKQEIPDLIQIQKQYGQDLVVIGISIDDPLDKMKAFAGEYHMNYPVLMGKDRPDVEDAFGPLFGIPVSVFVDRDGNIWKRHTGIASRAQFEREIKALL